MKFRQKELEARNYQTQVNPHSLSNMLQALQLAIIKNPAQAENYCRSMASLQRDITKYANPKRTSISLTNELATLEKYMRIQQEICLYNFTFHINIAQEIDTDSVYVPPLFLRPLVENAILHGISSVPYRGEIQLRISKTKVGYAYSIKDNGIGYAKSIEQKNTNEPSFGLQNTKDRIAYLCNRHKIKNEFSIQVLQPGTLIRFVLPQLNINSI
jgi:sensor histidine kinase YesM